MIRTLAQLTDDITEVTDIEGDTWGRDQNRPGWWRSPAHKSGISSRGLLALFGPLTPTVAYHI